MGGREIRALFVERRAGGERAKGGEGGGGGAGGISEKIPASNNTLLVDMYGIGPVAPNGIGNLVLPTGVEPVFSD